MLYFMKPLPKGQIDTTEWNLFIKNHSTEAIINPAAIQKAGCRIDIKAPYISGDNVGG